jgi:hypothetical protein
MSLRNIAAAGLIAAATFAAGCDNSSSTTPTDAATPSATPSAGATADRARMSADGITTQAGGAQDQMNNAMENATTRASGAASGASTRASGAATQASGAASDAGNATVTQAQGLYTQAQTAISGMKFDEAQKHVDQLKGMRSKLPAEWQTRVDQLGTMLTDAKSKMGNMPSMPSAPR